MAESFDELPGWLQIVLVLFGILIGLLGVNALAGGSAAAIVV